MKNSLKKNLTYQTIYQIIITITPLITSPYLSRTLGAEGLGIYSFTQSIVNYFMLFAMLGFSNYGTRSIAMCKTKDKQNELFSEIYTIQIISSLIAIFFYILFIIFYNYDFNYMLLQIFWLLSCLFDVTWYFFGVEEYKTTVLKNIIIKLLTVLSIILFVKNTSDVLIYIFIMSFSTFISQYILWHILRKKISFKLTNLKETYNKHFKFVITLFLPYLAMSVYHIMDKTMLGFFSNNQQSGFYYNSDKIVNIPLGILNGVGTVMLSRISSIQNEDNSKIKISKLINSTIICIMWIGIALSLGITAISKDFIPLFFGNGYDECILLVQIFSIILLIKALGNIVQSQYMIPFKKERQMTKCICIGVIINLIANYLFIKVLNFGALGATLGTLLAESVVCIMEVYICNKEIYILKNILKSILFAIPGIGMFILIKFISTLIDKAIVKIIIEILLGGILYLILSFSLVLKLLKIKALKNFYFLRRKQNGK